MLLYRVDRNTSTNSKDELSLIASDPFFAPLLSDIGFYDPLLLSKHIQDLYQEGLSQHGWSYLKKIHRCLGQAGQDLIDTSTIIEMLVEYVRQSHYPHLPSRLQSTFACETLDEAIIFRTNYRLPTDRILELEASEFVKRDMSLLKLGFQNVAGSYLAHQYWKGLSSPSPFWEYVVKLPVKIVREIV